MSLVKQLGILVAIGGLVAAVLAFDPFGIFIDETQGTVSPGRAEEAARAAPVVVEAVRYSSDAAVVEAVGTGEALNAATLYPEAAGRVVAVHFVAGQHVEKGAPLLELDRDEDKLAVDLARVALKDAQQQLKRHEEAEPSGAVSSIEVDRARTALSAARIQLAQAELALQNRTLVAPFAGVIGFSNVFVGDRVTEATPIATLDDRSSVMVDFEVPETFAYGVALGGEVNATTWALPGESFVGTVESVGSRIDSTTRTLRVRASLPNEQDRLRPGMSFTIRLALQGKRFPSVPSIAVQWDREGAYVWRIVEDRAERVAVRALRRERNWVLVDAPLTEGDRVVVEGVQRLRTGHAVEIVDEGAALADGPRDGA
ncbi:MAG: efflux RND transporter periplasmic adaptor subunit [Alphaproteobacteria bacterium]